jgi:Phage integrase, N-terminal SAM-like domain
MEMTMTPLRCRMIEDMRLAGLAARSQAIYVKSVRRLAAHYRRSPEQLSEEEVRSYLVRLRDRGVARGTFKVAHYAIQFLYQQTLGRDWPLFSKKRFVCRSTSGCRMRWPTTRSAICSVA